MKKTSTLFFVITMLLTILPITDIIAKEQVSTSQKSSIEQAYLAATTPIQYQSTHLIDQVSEKTEQCRLALALFGILFRSEYLKPTTRDALHAKATDVTLEIMQESKPGVYTYTDSFTIHLPQDVHTMPYEFTIHGKKVILLDLALNGDEPVSLLAQVKEQGGKTQIQRVQFNRNTGSFEFLADRRGTFILFQWLSNLVDFFAGLFAPSAYQGKYIAQIFNVDPYISLVERAANQKQLSPSHASSYIEHIRDSRLQAYFRYSPRDERSVNIVPSLPDSYHSNQLTRSGDE